jgi:hypothetical protein
MQTGCHSVRKPRTITGYGIWESTTKVITHGYGVGVAVQAVANRVIGRPCDGGITTPPKPSTDFSAIIAIGKSIASLCPRPALVNFHEVALLWDARKRKKYIGIANNMSAVSSIQRDAKLRCFIKPEKHFGPTIGRVISPRNPRYNIRVAQYLKPLEKSIYHALDKYCHNPTVLKCANQTQRAQAIQHHISLHGDWVAVGLDASRFDQHVSKDILEVEHSVYLHVYGWDVRLKRLLDFQLTNYCTMQCVDGKLSWVSSGGRMSGDMNTAMGNVLLSVLMLIELRNELGNSMTFINDGDDCVCFMNRRHLQPFLTRVKSFYLERGFTMKVEAPVSELEHIEFCQSKPVDLGDGYRMVRIPGKVLRQDSLVISMDPSCDYRKWLYGVGYCGLAITSGCPVLQDYYQSLMRNGTPHRVDTSKYVVGSGHARRAADEGRPSIASVISDSSRLSFWKAFGMDATLQREVEQVFQKAILADDSAPTELTPC